MTARYASGCVKLLLQATVILIFVFSTSCSKQCEPTSSEGDGAVIIKNVGIKLCQLKCDESGQCSSIQYNADTLTCRLLRAESMKTKTKEGYVSLACNHPDVQTGSSSSKMCSLGHRCLKTRSGKSVCVQDGIQNDPEQSPQRQVDKEETFGIRSLHEACRKGNLARVKHILCQDDVNKRDGGNGNTPLINSRGREGLTPLMTAAKFGHKDVCIFLVNMGANVSKVDYNGNCILHLGCEHLCVMEYLLSLGNLDINSSGHGGWTPLMATASSGHKEVCDLLVRMGANVALVDRWGNNVLHWGCIGGDLDTMKYLLSLGSLDINSRGQRGRTPLMLAAYHRHAEIVQYIISQNMVDIKARDRNGKTAAMIAKTGTRIKKFLISRGCPGK